MKDKILLAFDFDHTIIEENSDVCVHDLFPNKTVPEDLKSIPENSGWTAFMQALFTRLHENGVGRDKLLSCLSSVKFTPEMESVLKMNDENVDIIIISDSNTLFIEKILYDKDVDHFISDVYTNPAQFDSAGMLKIKPFGFQDWCPLSEKNMCKASILIDHVNKKGDNGVNYPFIAYVGDGSNDLCPSLSLRSQDFVFARKNFMLPKLISGSKGAEMKATVVEWETAAVIKNQVSVWSKSIEDNVMQPRIPLIAPFKRV